MNAHAYPIYIYLLALFPDIKFNGQKSQFKKRIICITLGPKCMLSLLYHLFFLLYQGPVFFFFNSQKCVLSVILFKKSFIKYHLNVVEKYQSSSFPSDTVSILKQSRYFCMSVFLVTFQGQSNFIKRFGCRLLTNKQSHSG